MRGRPVYSNIRQNIVELLYFMGKGYGYEIYQAYVDIFPKVTMRSVYYQLRKGVSLGEFEIESVKTEKGDYSWGPDAEKIYYKLGKNGKPKIDERIKEYFSRPASERVSQAPKKAVMETDSHEEKPELV
jgi:hypothetical protein